MYSDAHHRFIPEEPDWGFTRFNLIQALNTIQPGSTRSIIQNDCTTIVVYVKVFKDPTGVLWHNFVKFAL